MKENNTVLMVEDDINLLNLNTYMLEKDGYTVHTAGTLGQARNILEITPNIDIAVLDIELPDGNGLLFANEVKEKISCPILMLTSKNKHDDIVEGLNSSADMYMVKPYFIEELAARIDGLIKKAKKETSNAVIKGNLHIDLSTRQAKIDDVDLSLTPREFLLLLYLAKRENELIPTEIIFKEVWGQELESDKSALQNAISRLRKKLKSSGYTISTSRNIGYVFECI